MEKKKVSLNNPGLLPVLKVNASLTTHSVSNLIK